MDLRNDSLDEILGMIDITNVTKISSTDSSIPQKPEKKLPLQRHRIKENSRLLPQRSIDIMTEWYDNHYANPYPTYKECEYLAQAGQITISQVKQWFVNVRRRTHNQYRKKRTVNVQKISSGLGAADDEFFAQLQNQIDAKPNENTSIGHLNNDLESSSSSSTSSSLNHTHSDLSTSNFLSSQSNFLYQQSSSMTNTSSPNLSYYKPYYYTDQVYNENFNYNASSYCVNGYNHSTSTPLSNYYNNPYSYYTSPSNRTSPSTTDSSSPISLTSTESSYQSSLPYSSYNYSNYYQYSSFSPITPLSYNDASTNNNRYDQTSDLSNF